MKALLIESDDPEYNSLASSGRVVSEGKRTEYDCNLKFFKCGGVQYAIKDHERKNKPLSRCFHPINPN